MRGSRKQYPSEQKSSRETEVRQNGESRKLRGFEV